MKKLLTLTVILYSLIFSSVSFGEWTKVATHAEVEVTVYLDFERMRIHNGSRYLWRLDDYLDSKQSQLSYTQMDCEVFRVKTLHVIKYTQPMGEGSGETAPPSLLATLDWYYPLPNSKIEAIVTKVCEKEISTK